MNEKNKGGRPPRYEGEVPIRVGGTVRPRYKQMLDMLRRHRDTSINEVLEFAIARASHTIEIEGKSIYDWCVSDFEIYWGIYKNISVPYCSISIFKLMTELDTKMVNIINDYPELEKVMNELYESRFDKNFDFFEFDEKLTFQIDKCSRNIQTSLDKKSFTSKIKSFFDTLVKLGPCMSNYDYVYNSFRGGLKNVDQFIIEIESKPLKMQHISELYKLSYFQDVKKMSVVDRNISQIMFDSSIENILYEFWKSDISVEKLVFCTKKLFEIVAYDNFSGIGESLQQIDIFEKFTQTLIHLGVREIPPETSKKDLELYLLKKNLIGKT